MSYYQHGAAQQSAPPVSYYATPQTPSATAYGQAAVQAAVQASAYGTPTQQPQPYYPQQPANYPPSYGTQGQWAGTYPQVHTGGAAAAPTYQYSQAPVQYPQPSSQPNQQQYANQYQPYQQQYPVQASQVGTGFPQQAQPAPGYQAAGAQQYHQASGYYGQSHPYPSPQGLPSDGSFSPLPLPPGARGGGGHRGGFGGYRGDRGGRGGRGSVKRHDGGRSGVMKDDDPPREPMFSFLVGLIGAVFAAPEETGTVSELVFMNLEVGIEATVVTKVAAMVMIGDHAGAVEATEGGVAVSMIDMMTEWVTVVAHHDVVDMVTEDLATGMIVALILGLSEAVGVIVVDMTAVLRLRKDHMVIAVNMEEGYRRTDDRDHRHLGDYEFDEDMPRSAQRRGRDRGDVVIEDGVEAYYKKSFTEDPWADLLPDEMPVF
ncbi:hypothetical protein SpCBS45565_g06837 [Spizellomyces sp. 'palustris']|nr:hypothetical protein SpCBS45565_g06837 [Spizellomyces sp. 'palustris']